MLTFRNTGQAKASVRGDMIVTHFSALDIANRMAERSDIAHQRETANASARISAHLNDEPICVLKTTGEDRIEFMCEVDPDCSWEQAHTEIRAPEAIFNLSVLLHCLRRPFGQTRSV